MRPVPLLAVAAFAVAASWPSTPATADSHNAEGMCRTVQVDMVPTDELQIVVWLEDAQGNYVDTLYITRLTGSFGLGNRPGMMEFNTAWRWPYGRRTTTFPVWAHRHGLEWPLVIFQNGDDTNLSHPLGQSSIEGFYCRPLREGENAWDTQTCASTIYTDKGVLSDSETSRYPPRSDLSMTEGIDHTDVAMFDTMNPFDTVSKATPPGGQPYQLTWAIPDDLPPGDYVAWVEVSKELDQNEFYDFPEPVGIPWSEYGVAYRGQPSVVYRVPFSLTDSESIGLATDYAGYGDPDGLTGMLFPPDNTITTGVSGSGASRLMLHDDGSEMFRVKVSARPTFDGADPGAPTELEVVDLTPTGMTVSFVAPGDDGDQGIVAGYDIRLMVGEPLTADNWDDASQVAAVVTPDEPGTVQLFDVPELLPRTNYYLGIRAFDECNNLGEITVVHALTPEREPGRVDACFVATAAYGSFLEGEVTMLRSFRDKYLRTSVTGEILVEGYYTFGPALAQLIAPSDTARRAARAGLAPLVDAIRGLAAEE